MSEIGTLFTSLLVIGFLWWLLSFVVGGKGPSLPSRPRMGGGFWSRPTAAGGNVGVFEVFFTVLAVANLIASESVSRIGPAAIVLGLVALVVGYRFFSGFRWVVVGIGAAAAIADVALSSGPDAALAVAVVALFLGWIFGAPRLLGSR